MIVKYCPNSRKDVYIWSLVRNSVKMKRLTYKYFSYSKQQSNWQQSSRLTELELSLKLMKEQVIKLQTSVIKMQIIQNIAHYSLASREGETIFNNSSQNMDKPADLVRFN